MFTHEPITATDLRAAAETLGTWDLIRNHSIQSASSADVHHSPVCHDGTNRYSEATGVPLQELTGTLCSCVTEDHAYFDGGMTLTPGEKFLQLTLLQHYARVKKETFEEISGLDAWLGGWSLAAGSITAQVTRAHTTSRNVPWETSETDTFLVISDRLYQETLLPLTHLLVGSSTDEYRKEACERYLAERPLWTEPRDATEVLVGVHKVDAYRLAGKSGGQDIIATGLVRWSGGHNGTNFYRMPQWAHNQLMRALGGSYSEQIQCVPWRDDHPLEVIAGLWSPRGKAELADLQVAVEAAGII